MGVIYIMLGISLLLSFSFLAFFFWASKNQQFSDLDTPSWRAILDEQEPKDTKVKGEQNGS